MNLMFWKKKSGSEKEARENTLAHPKPNEALDFVAEKQGVAKQNTNHAESEAAGENEANPEAPVKRGIAASLKMRLVAMVRHFKKPPEFRADDEAELNNTLPEEPGNAARSKKWLAIGISGGLLVLLLVALAVAYWPTSEPPQEHDEARQETVNASSHSGRSVSKSEAEPDEKQSAKPEQAQSDIETLKKQNAELQAQVEALKLQASSQKNQSLPPLRTTRNNSIPASGDMVVDSKDPKATAMSLKEAIEAMNAGTGDYEKKPAK